MLTEAGRNPRLRLQKAKRREVTAKRRRMEDTEPSDDPREMRGVGPAGGGSAVRKREGNGGRKSGNICEVSDCEREGTGGPGEGGGQGCSILRVGKVEASGNIPGRREKQGGGVSNPRRFLRSPGGGVQSAGGRNRLGKDKGQWEGRIEASPVGGGVCKSGRGG